MSAVDFTETDLAIRSVIDARVRSEADELRKRCAVALACAAIVQRKERSAANGAMA